MTDPFLNPTILQRITGKSRGYAQAKQLARRGIKYLVNSKGDPILDGNGHPLVPVDSIGLGGVYDSDEPDFGAI